METGKGKYIYKTIPDCILDSDNLEDMNKKEIIEELDDVLKDDLDSLEDYCGDDVKISYKILDKEKIDKDDLKDIEEELEDDLDCKVKVSKGYEVTIKTTIKGDDEKKSNSSTINVYKIDGEWVLLDTLMNYLDRM